MSADWGDRLDVGVGPKFDVVRGRVTDELANATGLKPDRLLVEFASHVVGEAEFRRLGDGRWRITLYARLAEDPSRLQDAVRFLASSIARERFFEQLNESSGD